MQAASRGKKWLGLEIKKAKGEARKQERGETPSSDGAERLKLGGKEQKAGIKKDKAKF